MKALPSSYRAPHKHHINCDETNSQLINAYPGRTRYLLSHRTYCSVSDGGVFGAPCASSAARLAAFLCSRLSAFARCLSCRFRSFWRFWKVMLMGLLGKSSSIPASFKSSALTSAVRAAGERTRGNPHARIHRDLGHRCVRRRYCCVVVARPWASLR